MMISRILLLAASCALTPSAWAGAGLTSAGVDPTAGNNNVPQEPTLAQVAPVATQGQPGAASAGSNSPVLNPGVAGANAAQTATGAADGAKTAAAPVVVVPTPPPPPPDPSTLPVSVIKPLNKTAESAPPKADAESTVTTMAKPARSVSPNAAAESVPAQVRAPTTPVPARVQQPAPAARAEPARSSVDAAATNAAPNSATADGSANGFVFYTGAGIAAIILALSFAGFMRAGKDSGRPRA
jgi:hypothetical protein